MIGYRPWGHKESDTFTFTYDLKPNRIALRRKVMTNLDSILKTRDISLPTKVHLVKAMV